MLFDVNIVWHKITTYAKLMQEGRMHIEADIHVRHVACIAAAGGGGAGRRVVVGADEGGNCGVLYGRGGCGVHRPASQGDERVAGHPGIHLRQQKEAKAIELGAKIGGWSIGVVAVHVSVEGHRDSRHSTLCV